MKYLHVMIVIAVLFTACNPVATATQSTIPRLITNTPFASSTPEVPTSAITPIFTEKIYPTFTPAPTSTAIATLQPGQPLTLANLHMLDELNGWGIDVGEHIVHTTDGGHTWKDVTPRNGAYRERGFFALDANTAWATPYQVWQPNNASMWHTSDGGKTWQEQHICLVSPDCGFDFSISNPDFYLPITVQFLDAETGRLLFIVAHLMFQDRYRLYQTTDGGTHWSPIIDSDSPGAQWVMTVTGLTFQDKQIGWMSTSQIDGATDPKADWSIYRTTDAGLTWDEMQLPEPNPLPETFAHNKAWCGANGVDWIPPEALGVIIHCNVYEENKRPSYDFYYHSIDGGQTWVSWLKTGDVDFIDAFAGWRSIFNNAAYDLEQTHDGGQTWSKIKTVQWNGDLDFVNEQIGWAIATNGAAFALVHTSDGGKTWEELKPVVSP